MYQCIFLIEEGTIKTIDGGEQHEDNQMKQDVFDGHDEFHNGNQLSDQQHLLANLINSVPVNQRPAISAVLRQRQAQRIRSKSMVHQNLTIPKEG